MIEFDKIKSIHFVGIKGVGMAALATWAKKRGYLVSGSDVGDSFPTDRVLKRFAIPVFIGFNPRHVRGKDLVIVTGAHGGLANSEAREAIRKNIPTLLHGEALGEVMRLYKGIAVSGCHGKTTTSAMIVHLLKQNDYDPSYAIGCGEILSLGNSGWAGQGEYFVAEADEYINGPPRDARPKFLFLHPEIAVVTNIDYDHPDAYRSLKAVEGTYLKFTRNVLSSGVLVLGIDNPSVRRIMPKIRQPYVTYGTRRDADVVISRIRVANKTIRFSLHPKKEKSHELTLQIPGQHNANNAAAAAIVARFLGISWELVIKSLQSFRGTSRRFEFIKEHKGVVYYDDYAHHPAEIEATLAGARLWHPQGRIIALFQPHTFSRTKALLSKFARAFSAADVVGLTDIYASAREKIDLSVSSEQLAKLMGHYQRNVHYLATRTAAASFIKQTARQGDLVLTMGAGDIYSWHQDF